MANMGLAGGNTDTHFYCRAPLRFELFGEAAHCIQDLDGCLQAVGSVINIATRSAPYSHHTVANILVDCAVVLNNNFANHIKKLI